MKAGMKIKVKLLTLAVKSTLLIGFAFPQAGVAADEDSDLYSLTHPTNTVEFGGLYASQSSAKFGQYNGLNKESLYGLGNFNLRGGPGYDGKGRALRWWLQGNDVGTTSRSFTGNISEQGQWSFSLGYDELRHNITNTYQSPLLGNTGDNQFNLPADFGKINSANNTPGTRALSATQLKDFRTVQEYSTRQNVPVSATYLFSPELSAQFDFKHTDQTGAKLLGASSQGGINIGNVAGRAEAITILLNPTSYTTDNFNAALNWRGENAHLTGGYYGSIFHDNFNSVSWQSPMANGNSNCTTGVNCYVNNTMGTAPSNVLHQVNLNGGYDFTKTTKLAGGFSWGYNTQNDSFATTNTSQPNGTIYRALQGNGISPVSSLNGQVETTHIDIKLTDQSFKDLTLNAGFKFNERNNQTNSNIYNFKTLGDANYTGINMPYSNRKSQYEASAAYRLTKNQTLRLGYERESIDRWCDSVVGGLGCVATRSTNEDKINLNYRLKAFDNVNFNAGYNYGNRTASYDPNFMFAAYQTGITSQGLNGENLLGYVAYPYANRNQNVGKAGVNWQVTQQIDLGLNGNYTYDNYDATLGVQNRRSAGVNVDLTYNYAENHSLSAYYNFQNGFRNLRSGKNGNNTTTAPTQLWTNQLDDTSNAFGLMSRHTGLLDGKLEIIGDVSYALDKSAYSTQVYYVPTCGASNTLTCGNLSPIKNELLSLKLTGNYKIHKNGKLALSYLFQQLNSNDYFYNAQQFGYTPNTLLPTGLQPQSYAVSVVGLSYIYNF